MPKSIPTFSISRRTAMWAVLVVAVAASFGLPALAPKAGITLPAPLPQVHQRQYIEGISTFQGRIVNKDGSGSGYLFILMQKDGDKQKEVSIYDADGRCGVRMLYLAELSSLNQATIGMTVIKSDSTFYYARDSSPADLPRDTYRVVECPEFVNPQTPLDSIEGLVNT